MHVSPLRQYIAALEAAGDLTRISVPVDPIMEIAAVTNRVCKQPQGGVALLFERPVGSPFQVATNLFGSEKRVCSALGAHSLNELTVRLHELIKQIPDFEITSLDRQIAGLPDFLRFAPQLLPEADPALITMKKPDLASFPFLQIWPGDGTADGHGRYITLPQIFTNSPDGSAYNCGLYRVQLRGTSEVAIQWKKGSGAARHAELYRAAGKKMPVAITLGGDPSILFSAMFPLPGDLDEITFAGFLRGAPLVMTSCRSISLKVPAGVEIVIEGYVEPGEIVTEGPFGNHTGFYSPASPAALMRVTAIRHRTDAVIPATVVGPPPMEDCWMAKAWERLLLAFLRKLVPAIIDIHFPSEWVFHNSAIISLEKPNPGMIRNIAAQLWALEWFAKARIVVFVTSGTEPLNISHAVWKIINMASFTDDILNDPETGRMALDATLSRIDCPELSGSTECAALVEQRWKEYGLA